LLANAVRSLRRLTDGSVVRPENAARQFGLTDRESEVLAELMRGSSYTEIGAKLFISLATVKTHVNRIYRKTDTRSRPELMNRLRPVYGDGAESQPSG
jgi:DNA-binding CsgD family transcriptional regulator